MGANDKPALQPLRYGYAVMKAPADFDFLLTEGTPNLITALGVGTPGAVELLAAAEVAGVAMASLDEVYGKIPSLDAFFKDWDRVRTAEGGPLHSDLQARICFSALNAADTGVDWTLHLKGFAASAVLSDAKSSADGTATFAAQTTLATALQYTEWRFLDCENALADDEAAIAAVTLADSGDASADEVKLVGLEFRYTRDPWDPTGIADQT